MPSTIRKLARRLSDDLPLLIIGNGVEAVFRFGAFVLWSQALGPAGVGQVATVIAVTQLLAQVTEVGIDTTVLSLVSKANSRGLARKAAALSRAGFQLQAALAGIVLAGGALLAWPLAELYLGHSDLLLAVLLGFLGLAISRLALFCLAVLRAYQRFRAYTLSGVASAALLLVLTFVLYQLDVLDVTVVLLLTVVVIPLSRLLFVLPLVPAGVLGIRGVHPARRARLLRFTRWVFGTALGQSTVRRLNILYLQALAGDAAVGYLHTGYRYTDFLTLLFTPLNRYLLPRFAAAREPHAIRAVLASTYRWLAWLWLLVPVAWLLSPLIEMVQGPAWAPVLPVFLLLVVSRLTNFMGVPLSHALLALQQPRIEAALWGVFLAAFVVLAWLPIGAFGAMGCALVMLTIGIVKLLVLGLALRRALA